MYNSERHNHMFMLACGRRLIPKVQQPIRQQLFTHVRHCSFLKRITYCKLFLNVYTYFSTQLKHENVWNRSVYMVRESVRCSCRVYWCVFVGINSMCLCVLCEIRISVLNSCFTSWIKLLK